MSQATWYTGDALTVLKTLPDASVDLVLTSPPFLALRSYLPADDPNKALEIGSEATPGEFLDVLLDVVEELRRVLAPHGSLVVELGDTYSGSIMNGGDLARLASGETIRPTAGPLRGGTQNRGEPVGRGSGEGWPLPKSLCMVPSSFAFALAYGRNPWTGRTLEPWRVRNLIAWCRPNPPVGALGDKFRPGTSYLVVACVSNSRFFDLDAVREPHRRDPDSVSRFHGSDAGTERRHNHGRDEFVNSDNPAGAPPLDWWEIPTYPFPGAHFATMAPQVCVRPIKAMCPSRVCRVCGKPSERITEQTDEYKAARAKVKSGAYAPDGQDKAIGRVDSTTGDRWANAAATEIAALQTHRTLGWSDCGHNKPEFAHLAAPALFPTSEPSNWRNGVVLDPFAGSGTTLEVATGHGRDAIGIDLDPRNYELARQRIGMFLTEAEGVLRG